MLIIAGKLYVAAEQREAHLASLEDFVRRTRNEPGCLDFIIAADPIEAGRVNLFERWASRELLEAFQGRAEPPAPVTEVFDEDVAKYEISTSGPVFP
jgi:quinol monooxygenase YgiN